MKGNRHEAEGETRVYHLPNVPEAISCAPQRCAHVFVTMPTARIPAALEREAEGSAMTTAKQSRAAWQLLQRKAREQRKREQQRRKAHKLPRVDLPPYAEFVEQKAKQAAHFFDSDEWVRLARFRKHMSENNRARLRDGLEPLIREAERVIEATTERGNPR
jgi:hypothetical protein